jgi:hypothetical protein
MKPADEGCLAEREEYRAAEELEEENQGGTD